MTLVITPGETALLGELKDRGITPLVEPLLVGDAHIKQGDTVVYIFERKAKTDLDASIKDGRYHEQKERLIQTGVPKNRIIYIIEQLTKPDKTSHSRIWGAICNTMHRDGFGVFQTKSVSETVDYLTGMCTSVTKFPLDGEPVAVNVQIKKSVVQPEQWYTQCLTLIPGVSVSIAEAISTQFPSFKDLHATSDTDLANVKHGASSRRVGPKLCEKIRTYISKLCLPD